jgi:hypothetical protein
LGSDKRKFPKWLMTRLTEPKTKIETIIPDEALIALSICQTKGLLIDRLPMPSEQRCGGENVSSG